MKKFLLIPLLLLLAQGAESRHITGGEVIYDYLGPGNLTGSKLYRITLRLFRDENCVNCADLPPSVTMGVFNNDNNSLVSGTYRVVNLNNSSILPITTVPPCITNQPNLVYRMGIYLFDIELPSNSTGYTATFQTCCRIDNIMNTGNSVGATYTGRIPAAINDNSPRFSTGISIVCFRKPFTLDFSATDPDAGDSLVYSLCNAFNGGDAADASFATPAPPPYNSIVYTNGYTGSAPLGIQATINPATGIISGIAPDAGRYVVSVCISVFRNGVLIGQHRKDFIITVAACDFAGTELEPDYITCDGFTLNFNNLNTSPLNQTFYWDFNDPGSGAANISTAPNPVHTFSDTGVYNIKLVVNRGSGCSDSTYAIVRVYPGFFPGFGDNTPICKGNPVQFSDSTRSNNGVVNSWRWNFGDNSVTSDTSDLQNPTYTYSASGFYDVTLIAGSSKGCLDTITQRIEIVERPSLVVSNDTLICTIDTIQLLALADPAGSVSWTPDVSISNTGSFTPAVSPDISTTYYVTYTDTLNCTARDSVRVNVISQVNLTLSDDTTICRGDAITLSASSNGLYYEWTPASTLNNAGSPNPVATPTDAVTVYTVKAGVSANCFTTGQVTITTVPYPAANATGDTSICLGGSAFLNATGGSIYSWTPPVFLSSANIPDPTVQNPGTSVRYIVRVTDVLGCPKPTFDTVFVNVIEVRANAGPRDTSVVFGQPLRLNATGGSIYQWTPPTWLSNPNISNPVSLPENDIEYIVRVTDGPGCTGQDTIFVRLYRLPAGLQVPTAFSPNGDGLNDVFKPIPLGMLSVDLFRVYNRWGEMVFSTSQIGRGWDGTFRGSPQSGGTYVWYVEGITYENKKVARKGTVVLIR